MATTIHSAKPALTTNDSAVLQALFDAESSPSSSAVQIDPSLPALPTALNISAEDHTTLKNRELAIIQTLQSSPSTETIETAISNLSTLITEFPNYPSAYVNRAQALRLLIESTSPNENETVDPLFIPQNSQPSSTLFSDLTTAITLTAPGSPTATVSTAQARILSDAHTHRGYILLKGAKSRRTPSFEGQAGPDALRGVGADQLEEMASRDFFFGGQYGNEIARQLAVQTNPYAKMCGAIVKEALRKEVEGA